MKRIISTLFALVAVAMLWAQNPSAYTLFDKEGNKVTYQQLIDGMSQMNLVFLGEIHNCPIAHWMEKLIIKDLHAIHGDKLMLGAEMFERDDQLLVDEYLNGMIPESKFKAEAKLWDNYDTDYAPIMEFAKKHSLPFIATNVARRYANIVSKDGLEALEKVSEKGRELIAPLPIEYIQNPLVDEYFKSSLPPMMKNASVLKLAQAQAVKDATMAWSISQNLKEYMIHVNGSYHSTGHAGIIDYLNTYRPGLKIGTVEVVRQEKNDSLEERHKGHADFFICIPSDMNTTF